MSTADELQAQINALQKELEQDPSRAPEIWAKQQALQVKQQEYYARGAISAAPVQSRSAPAARSGASPGFFAPESEFPSGIPSGYRPAASAPIAIPGVPDGASTSAQLPSNAPAPIAKYAAAINNAAELTGVPAALIAAVVFKESQGSTEWVTGRLNESHKSAGVALGLMQVEPNTSPEILAQHQQVMQGLDGAAFDTALGAFRLADLARQFGSWDKVLRAYNSGAWAPVLSDPAAPITTGDPHYVERVNAWWVAISQGKQLPCNLDPASLT